MDGNSIPPRFESHYDRLSYLLAEYKIGVYIAVLAVTALIVSGRLGIPEMPSGVAWALKWTAIGIIPAMVAAKVAIVDRWIPDPRKRILVVDLEDEIDVTGKLCPQTVWSKRETGEHPAIEPDRGMFDAIVTKFDWDDDLGRLEVEGGNEELVLEVLTTQGKLDAVYGQLLEDSAKLDRLQAQQRLKTLEIEERIVNSLIAAVEHGLEFDPGTTEEIVDSDLESDNVDANKRTRDASRSDDQEERPTLREVLPDTARNEIDAVERARATDGGRDQ
ncbi:hypothetical protein GCM10010451_66350 [Streptomyces virens]